MDEIRLHDLQEARVWDVDDAEVGFVGQVHLNPTTEKPEWVSVPLGILSSGPRFIPLDGAYIEAGSPVPDLHVNYRRGFIHGSPEIDPVHGLTPTEEDRLRTYYGLDDSADGTADGRTDDTADDTADDPRG